MMKSHSVRKKTKIGMKMFMIVNCNFAPLVLHFKKKEITENVSVCKYSCGNTLSYIN